MTSGEPSQSSFHIVGRHGVGRQRSTARSAGAGRRPRPAGSCPASPSRRAGSPSGSIGHRALDEVAGRERRDDVLAGGGVDEVDGAVVGAEDHPGPAVPLEHRGLARSSPCRTRSGSPPRRWTPSTWPSPGYVHCALGLPGHRALAVVAAGRVAPEGQQALDGGVGEGLARRTRGRPSPRTAVPSWWSAGGTVVVGGRGRRRRGGRRVLRGRRRRPPGSRRRPCPRPRGRPRRPGATAADSPPGRGGSVTADEAHGLRRGWPRSRGTGPAPPRSPWWTPGLRTPRIDMHRCSASMTTITPLGWSVRSISSAIWVVSRSWTWGRRA